MPRRTSDQTRDLLISVGVKLLLDRGPLAGVSHVKLQDVVRRAGVTTGAAYRLWTDQTEFHHDLALAVIRSRANDPTANTRATIVPLVHAGGDLDEVIRQATGSYVDSLGARGTDQEHESRLYLLALAFRASSQTSAELQAASAERHRHSITDFTQVYQALMAHFGYRPRPPLTIGDFTEAMAALGEGFALHHVQGIEHRSADIPAEADLPAGRWTLFGLCVRALIQQFMEPDPDSGEPQGDLDQ